MRGGPSGRHLTPEQSRRVEALRRAARLLDSALVVPGTSYRIGLDPIVGLVPGIGDLVSPMFALAILWQGRELGVPRIVQLRMVVNVAIDAIVGAVPLLGDLFDFVWKANAKNLALLERHVAEERGSSPGDWIFILGVSLMLVSLALVPILLVGWIVARLFG